MFHVVPISLRQVSKRGLNEVVCWLNVCQYIDRSGQSFTKGKTIIHHVLMCMADGISLLQLSSVLVNMISYMCRHVCKLSVHKNASFFNVHWLVSGLSTQYTAVVAIKELVYSTGTCVCITQVNRCFLYLSLSWNHMSLFNHRLIVNSWGCGRGDLVGPQLIKSKRFHHQTHITSTRVWCKATQLS